MLRVVLAALGLALLASSSQAAEIHRYQVGNWTVGVYTDDTSNRFSSCIASAVYNSGITLVVLVSRDYQWDLGFSAPNWKLRPGERLSLRYRFDRSGWTGATAEIAAETLVRMPMPSNGPVAQLFRRSRTMEVHDGYQSYFFNLDGTARLLTSLVECVQTSLNSDQVASNPPSSPAVTTTPNVAAAQGGDLASLKLEGTRVLSNFLLAAELPGAELLAEADFPKDLAFAHAVAVAGDTIGFSFVVPTADVSPDALSAQIAAALSETCKGKFGTGSTKETVENAKLINAFTACQNQGAQSLLQYVVVSRKQGGQYVIGVLSEAAEPTAGKSSTGSKPPVNSDRLMKAAFQVSQ